MGRGQGKTFQQRASQLTEGCGTSLALRETQIKTLMGTNQSGCTETVMTPDAWKLDPSSLTSGSERCCSHTERECVGFLKIRLFNYHLTQQLHSQVFLRQR